MQTKLETIGRSFEELARLAQEDPGGFEDWRRQALESLFAECGSAERERKLRGLQFKIDAVRQIARTPLAACLKLNAMMLDTFLSLKEVVEGPVQPARRDGARILQFKPRPEGEEQTE